MKQLRKPVVSVKVIKAEILDLVRVEDDIDKTAKEIINYLSRKL